MREKDKNVDFNISSNEIDDVISIVWDDYDKKSRIQDSILETIKTQYSSDSIEDIYTKVTLINSFYSTNIYDVWQMSNHIKDLEIPQSDFDNGKTDLVDKIADVTFNNKKYTMYSFATKYCSLHNSKAYPIFDSYVADVLIYLKNTNKVTNLYKKQSDFLDYKKYKVIIKTINDKLGNVGYKKTDMYLWALGNIFFPKYEKNERYLSEYNDIKK